MLTPSCDSDRGKGTETVVYRPGVFLACTSAPSVVFGLN